MKEAIHEAEDVKVKVLKKRKKAAKKAKKEAGEKLKDEEGAGDESVGVMNGDGGMDAEELEQSAEK
ncbi:unnamed protein product, partial [Anisakis simplex]|uniref:Uncharacterized protein n=1 Tax=Anisakis simplex TaxID=6269 RepID=A0A0M3JN37_ANISI